MGTQDIVLINDEWEQYELTPTAFLQRIFSESIRKVSFERFV